MRVLAIRKAATNGGAAYDVLVPTTEVPDVVERLRYTTAVNRNQQAYLSYEDATVPLAILRMEPGADQFIARNQHDNLARREMLDIAEYAFPELVQWRLTADTLPYSWVPSVEAMGTSAEVILDVGIDTDRITWVSRPEN